MTFKPAIWKPIALVLAAVNLGGVWMAAQGGEAWHATLHGALAVAFAVWAQRLWTTGAAGARELPAGMQALEAEVNALRQELGEAQERLDFAERLLAQQPERRREDDAGR